VAPNGHTSWSGEIRDTRDALGPAGSNRRERIGEHILPCRLSAHRRFAYHIFLNGDLQSVTVSGFHGDVVNEIKNVATFEACTLRLCHQISPSWDRLVMLATIKPRGIMFMHSWSKLEG
jgi:hypothetical protein